MPSPTRLWAVYFMKRFQNALNTLIALQVAIVLLLGVMTILSYQNQAEVQKLALQNAAGTPDSQEKVLAERIAVLEARLGLRDPEAEAIKAQFAQAQAESEALSRRMQNVQGNAGAPVAPAKIGEIPGSQLPPAGSEVEPVAAPVLPANLTEEQRQVALLPVVATLVNYDAEWAFWRVDKGRFDGLKEQQDFAVRRKGTAELIARVRISTVSAEDAIVDVIPGSATDGVKPEIGDELVDTTKLPK